ncbi:hypothetical protein [Vandammella animalimorsus]|nr:hypothetical protein [Vandammella animalimorsus]
MTTQPGSCNCLAAKTYVAHCTYGCFYGEPRTATASVTWRW